MKNLIIVESPTKAKTIKNFLGKNYNVVASKGHIRDLPKSSFGIKIDNQTFIPEYRIPKDHASVVKEIKDLAKEADQAAISQPMRIVKVKRLVIILRLLLGKTLKHYRVLFFMKLRKMLLHMH